MTVVADGEVMLARIDDIRLCRLAVVGCENAFVYLELDVRRRFARGYYVGLDKPDKLDGGAFHPAGVRFLRIDLNDRLRPGVARVLHVDRHLVSLAVGGRRNRHIRIFKRRI